MTAASGSRAGAAHPIAIVSRGGSRDLLEWQGPPRAPRVLAIFALVPWLLWLAAEDMEHGAADAQAVLDRRGRGGRPLLVAGGRRGRQRARNLAEPGAGGRDDRDARGARSGRRGVAREGDPGDRRARHLLLGVPGRRARPRPRAARPGGDRAASAPPRHHVRAAALARALVAGDHPRRRDERRAAVRARDDGPGRADRGHRGCARLPRARRPPRVPRSRRGRPRACCRARVRSASRHREDGRAQLRAPPSGRGRVARRRWRAGQPRARRARGAQRTGGRLPPRAAASGQPARARWSPGRRRGRRHQRSRDRRRRASPAGLHAPPDGEPPPVAVERGGRRITLEYGLR